MRFGATKLQPNTPVLAAPSRHKAGCRPEIFEVRWLQNRGRRCNTETNIAFSEAVRTAHFGALAFKAKSRRPVPCAARMRAWGMTRSRCRYGREHTTKEKLDGGRCMVVCQAGLFKFYVLANRASTGREKISRRGGPRARRYRGPLFFDQLAGLDDI